MPVGRKIDRTAATGAENRPISIDVIHAQEQFTPAARLVLDRIDVIDHGAEVVALHGRRNTRRRPLVARRCFTTSRRFGAYCRDNVSLGMSRMMRLSRTLARRVDFAIRDEFDQLVVGIRALLTRSTTAPTRLSYQGIG